MKEERIKELLKKSTLNTSEDFTEKLLEQVNATNKPVRVFSLRSLIYPALFIFSFIIIFSGMAYSKLILPSVHHPIFNRTFFMVIILLLLFLGINHVLKLRSLSMNAENEQKAII